MKKTYRNKTRYKHIQRTKEKSLMDYGENISNSSKLSDAVILFKCTEKRIS